MISLSTCCSCDEGGCSGGAVLPSSARLGSGLAGCSRRPARRVRLRRVRAGRAGAAGRLAACTAAAAAAAHKPGEARAAQAGGRRLRGRVRVGAPPRARPRRRGAGDHLRRHLHQPHKELQEDDKLCGCAAAAPACGTRARASPPRWRQPPAAAPPPSEPGGSATKSARAPEAGAGRAGGLATTPPTPAAQRRGEPPPPSAWMGERRGAGWDPTPRPPPSLSPRRRRADRWRERVLHVRGVARAGGGE